MKNRPGKRNYERLATNLFTKFFYENSVYFGIITNISEKGVFINTHRAYIPINSKFEVFITYDNEVIKLSARVKWAEMIRGDFNGFGAEITGSSDDYLYFLEELREKRMP